MKKYCFLLILLSSVWTAHAQYLENFTGQNGKGLVDAICPPTATGISDCGCACTSNSSTTDDISTCTVVPPDLTGVTWTITGSDFTGFDHSSPDDFGVVSERFQANDNDNELCWVSPTLNIAAAGAVSISISAGEISDLEATDYIKAEYSLNGGAFVQFGFASDDFTSTTFSISGLTGTTLAIRVCIDINGSSRIIWFDDVSVPQSGVFINCAQPTVTAAVTDVVCTPNSGAIDLTVTGGSPPYTYAWTGGATTQDRTGLAPGTYSVTVTDNASCPIVKSYTVNNSPIVQNAATYPAYCDEANGSINLNVSGGIPPYTYAWTGGATTQDLMGVSAGNYTVTITDHINCTSVQTYTVGTQSVSPGPYLETFSTPNKGYLTNLQDDLFGVNWTLSPWQQGSPGRDATDYFQTTAGGKLEAVDVDFEVCWNSPVINITGAGSVQFSVDLTWQTLEAEDYIAVQYSLDGGAFTELSNIAGSGSHTVQYTSGINTNSGTASISGLTGSTLQIRICFLAESNSDIITIDNVSIPQTVSLCLPPPCAPPDAVCQNITAQLNSAGSASITGADIDNNSITECGLQSLAVDVTDFNCTNLGANTVTLTVTDNQNNTDQCTATVTVQDNVGPTALCRNVTVQLDAGGNGSTTASAVNNGSSDACGIQSLSLDKTAFTCANAGNNTVTLTVTDVNNNPSTCTATVTVADNVAPTALCQNVTIQLDANGNGSTTASAVNNGSSDNCGIGGLSLSQTAFSCGNVGSNTVTLTVTDVNNNPSTCTATVTVEDKMPPAVTCVTSYTVELNANGTYDIFDASFVFNTLFTSISDNCQIDYGVIFLTQPHFTCDDLGERLVGFYAQDGSGNLGGCTVTIIVTDPLDVCNHPPVAVCKNITVNANGNCQGTAAAADFDGGSSDQDMDMLSFSVNPAGPYQIGMTNVTLTVSDGQASSQCSATITVQDNTPPTALCRNVTVQLNGAGMGSTSAAAVNNGSSDNCGIQSTVLSLQSFSCGNVGANTVTLTVTDVNNNSSTCTATVTVTDNIAPTALCQNVTVQLDADGNGATTASAVNNGSSDACGVQSTVLNTTAFDCEDVGANTVTLTVTDVNNNSSTCTATVTVEDNVAPTALCQNVTVQLDANGDGSTTASAVDNGSNDACGVQSAVLSGQSFSCEDVGANTVTLTVTDVNNNSSTCTATVTVEDNVAPTALCQNVTVQLDANGDGSTTATAVDNGSSDACGIQSTVLSTTAFDCEDVGANTVTLTVTDVNNNPSTCTATVTVEDNIAPTALCQNVTVQLDANGDGSTTASAVNNGSSDACGIQSTVLSTTAFDCEDVGANTVTLTVTDVNNNSSTCTATVTVEDNVAPTALCQNVTVQLDTNGDGSTTASAVDNGSNDACGVQSAVLSGQSFSCEDVGGNTVTLTVTDVNDNSSTCTATVTVEDNVPPVALCNNITVLLDADGQGEITAQEVDNGSSDACGILSLALNQTKFDCENVGTVGVTLTVTDQNNNENTCSATITVEDPVAPEALCQNVTVQLDANGDGATTAEAVDNGSNDACGIQSLALSQTAFDCGDVGANTVTLTVTDVNNNSSTCTATITVEDNVPPVALCRNVTVQLDENGMGSTTAEAVDNGSNDACGIQSTVLSLQSFSCGNVGANTVTLTVTDVNDNSSTCTATVTVEDNIDPEIECMDITVTFNGEGGLALDPNAMATASDNCSVESLLPGAPGIDCEDLGEVIPVTVTATDPSGNSASCVSQVTVTGLPCGWMSMPDGIGCTSGNSTAYDVNSETFTLTASGCYTPSATADESGFIKYMLCGDGSITAHIAGLTLPGYAGIVMRESDDPGAKKVAMTYQGASAIARYVRYATNGAAYPSYINAASARWLRIVRTGNIFRGYYSVNGSYWVYAFAVTVPMNSCLQVGLIASGASSNSVVTATFDHVVINPPYSNNPLRPMPEPQFETVDEPGIELWPNPATGEAFMDMDSAWGNKVTVEATDNLGRRVKEWNFDPTADSRLTLDMTNQPPGVYFIRVRNQAGRTTTLRLVVTRP